MRAAVMTLAIAAGLALSGCDKLPSGIGSDAPRAAAGSAALALDQDVRGEITTSSGLNYSDGSRHQLYTLTLEKDQAVALQLDGALEGALAVFHGDAVVATTANGARQDGKTRLVFRAAEAGSYLVAVSGNSATAFGPFALRAQAVASYDGKPLIAGGEVVDWLTGAKQDYTLQADKAGLYTITMDSSAFDTVLAVSGQGVDASNDDRGDGSTNSRVRTYLEPGTYTLSASALGNQGGAGDFRLAVQFAEMAGGMVRTDGTALSLGQTVMGVLTSAGRRNFVLTLPTATTVRFDARSDDVDTLLRISGPSGTFEDDDGGDGTNARLALELQPGRYDVRVSSLNDGPGMFELETSADGDVAVPQADVVAVPAIAD